MWHSLVSLDYLSDTLERKLVFFTGKGGVGKSTLTWATALACRRKGRRVTVAGWQPSGKPSLASMAQTFDVQWVGIETLAAFREYFVGMVRFETLYNTLLDNKVFRTFVLAAPGLADSIAGGKIWQLTQDSDLLLVDLPATGHARSFFQAPLTLKKLFKVGVIARDAAKVCELFASPQTRLDLIATPEDLPLAECSELKADLQPLHPFHFGCLHLNQCLPSWLTDSEPSDPLPEQAKGILNSLSTRLEDQNELQSQAAGLGLPVLCTPHFPAAAWTNTIEAVARHLEQGLETGVSRRGAAS